MAEPGPGSTESTPGGRPACIKISASDSTERGVSWAGLTTTVLPQARAGAIFQEAMTRGKFQGVMRAHTPTGSRRVTSRPASCTGMVSPDLVCRSSPVLKYGSDKGNFTASVTDRLARVAGLEGSDSLCSLPDETRGLQQSAAPLCCTEAGPASLLESPVSSLHSTIDIFRSCLGYRDKGAAGRRLDDGKCFAIRGRNSLAA